VKAELGIGVRKGIRMHNDEKRKHGVELGNKVFGI
jgi:hypothetical protein